MKLIPTDSSLILFPFIAWSLALANTSEDNIEGSGQSPLSVAPSLVSRFNSENKSLPGPKQIFRSSSEHLEISDDKFDNGDYLYDDETAEHQRHQEMEPVNLRTTMAPNEAPVTSAFPTGSKGPSTFSSTATFATLVVDEVTIPSTTAYRPTRPPLKLVRLNDGDVIHRQRLNLDSPDELSGKSQKKPDWRRYWKSIPERRRFLVSKDIGPDVEDLPPLPPGAQLIQILHHRVRK